MPDVPTGKVPVIACVTAAWKFFFANWRQLLPAALAPALINGLAAGLSGAPGQPGGMADSYLGELPITIAMIFFTAAVLRKAVRNEFVAPTGLAFGQDEVRLLGALGCMLAIFLPPVLLAWYFLQTYVFDKVASSPAALNDLLADPDKFGAAVAGVLGEGGLLALDTLLIASMVIGVVALVRLSMVNATTIGERKLVFLRTWSWSRRNVLRILAALLLTNLPALMASAIVGQLVIAILAGDSATIATPMAMLGSALIGFVSAMLAIPSIALGAELYRGLKPPDFVAK